MKCITVGGPKGLTMGAANCYAYNPFLECEAETMYDKKTKGWLIWMRCERRHLNQTTQEKAAFQEEALSNDCDSNHNQKST